MSEQPDFVLACTKIGAVIYPDQRAVGLEIVDPAGQRLFVSLQGRVLAELAKQLQELADQHPEVREWQAVQLADTTGPSDSG